MRGLVWPAVRRPAHLLAILLLASGCVADANDPTAAGGQQGYPDVGRNLTRIPPAERTSLAEVTGPDLDGTGTLSSKTYSGKVVVINVWGSWCPPCRKEAPDLQAASEETAEIAQFLGVTSKDRQPAAGRGSSSARIQDHLPEHLRPERAGAAGLRTCCRPARSRRR